MAGPYGMTPAQGASARRKAALLRALAGVASQGPALGTDPFGSFQAGLRGALSMGAEQQAQQDEARRRAIQDQYMMAQIERMQRPPQEYGAKPWYMAPGTSPEDQAAYRADALYHPTSQAQDPFAATQQRLQAEGQFAQQNPTLWRLIHPEAQGRQSFAEKVREREAVLGRPLTDQEKQMAAGLYRSPLLEETERQVYDWNGPVFISANGRLTNEAFDVKTRQANRPYMTRVKRYYQGQGSDPLDQFYGGR